MKNYFNILAILSLVAMIFFNITYQTMGKFSALAFVSLLCFIVFAVKSTKWKSKDE